MYLKFPKRRDFWTWDELSCLSNTLGFQRDLFAKNVQKEKSKEYTKGIHLKDINEMFESKVLSPDLHRTFNMHDDTYNTKVMQKAIDLLSNRFLTFKQIKESRMAFQFYEHMDNAGLVISEHIILRALKMCGRAVSPVKLMQHLKHMDRLVPDRLMFYEFLDLILICEKSSAGGPKSQSTADEGKVSKNDKNLYELRDFRDLLLTEDEKSAERLNEAYKVSLEKLPIRKSKENTGVEEEKPWLVPPIVPRDVREKLGKMNKQHRTLLTKTLALSNSEVLAKGTFPSCNCDKPDLIPNNEVSLEFDYESESSFPASPANRLSEDVPVSGALEKPSKFRESPIVSQDDIDTTRMAIEEVRWSIATQSERTRRKKEETQKRPRFRTGRKPKINDQTKDTEDHVARGSRSRVHLDNSEDRPFRARIKELSLGMTSQPLGNEDQREEKVETNTSGENESSISLDERLKEIDLLVNRVCQR